ncbi:DUF3306 domain-containing protein [Cupriavidus sp. AU9028]|uniref:DUF3306 domain-containing protein n=1 Tax=Cupriavidus sp. AU9028 TaxID=2871157 RepID=UPI001C95CFD2|nr:DUF3306 domain-containing protein [Cupriavidus sp. AU9028]MBY4899295.1 DUF3306 domain-containing protein [Cupriavidus sp. AU9028]
MSDTRQSGDASFLSRWSRRKAAAREGKPLAEQPVQQPMPTAAPPAGPAAGVPAGGTAAAAPAAAPPVPTLEDVAQLKPGEEIARFVARGVDESVKRAALKTLFADPHFNVMDGLDIYIDDYTRPDPIPPEVLRRLTQSESLRLFEPLDEEEQASPSLASTQPVPAEPEGEPVPAPEAQDASRAEGEEPLDAPHLAASPASPASPASEREARNPGPGVPRDDPT